MPDPRMTNLARILVDHSVKVQQGEFVVIQTSIEALPMAREVLRQVILAGGNAHIHLEDDEFNELSLRYGSNQQLDWVSPATKMILEQVDVLIALLAPANTRNLNQIDPKKLQRREMARRVLLETYFKRSAAGEMRWTLTSPPCQALAQEAEMSLREYEDFVYAATYADRDDPVAAWQAMESEQDRLIQWLKGRRQLQLRGPNVDLSLSVDGRTFINSSGQRNVPDGEIFTGPVEDSANGWVKFTYPAVHRGQVVEGVELEFKDGCVTAARASKNQEYLLALLDSDPGARYLGEFAIGTNYAIQRFTKSILFDEKIGGSFHMAVGAGYPETGSHNKSSIHWDFICDMRQDSEILADGERFYLNGRFAI